MTPYTMQELISELGKRLNWDISLVVLPNTGKLEQDAFPLAPDLKRKIDKGEKVDRNNGASLDNFLGIVNSV